MISDLDQLFEALHRNFGTEYPDPRVTAIAERATRDEAVLVSRADDPSHVAYALGDPLPAPGYDRENPRRASSEFLVI